MESWGWGITSSQGSLGLLLTSLGLSAADAVQSGGLDLLGIAAVITAISGLIGAVGALVLGFRRRDAVNDRLVELMETLVEQKEDGS